MQTGKISAALLRGPEHARDGGLPTRFKLLNWGENPNANGKRVFVGERFRQLLSAAANPYRDRIPIDFEHNTFPGTPAYKEAKEPRPIAGYCRLEAVPGEGVYAAVLGWTPEGKAHAADFADVSAAVLLDSSGEVTMIPSVAVCRCGAVPDMAFAEAPAAMSAAAAALLAPAAKPEYSMDYRTLLLKLLGLKPDAVDEDIEDALEKIAKNPPPKPGDDDGRTLPPPPAKMPDPKDPAAVKTDPATTLSARIEALAGGVAALAARFDARDKSALVASARAQGKALALSDGTLARLSIADLKDIIERTPATVPVSALTPEALAAEPKAGAGELTEQDRKIALACGCDPEKMKKGAK
jgi:phage I-like protein